MSGITKVFARTHAAGRPRRGFTLFEIAISLSLVAFGVVSVLMLFPIGLRQLTVQRFRVYAACIANELVDVMGNADASQVFVDNEGPGPWDVNADRRVNAPDLEMKCSNQRYGLMPLPLDIARRLDSDGDEIRHLLDDGGYVYYVMPNLPNSWREDLLTVAPPNDLQKLVIGVVGNAQHNASFSFPMKRWPYYSTVPAPPLHVLHHPSAGWDTANPTGATPPAGNYLPEDPGLGAVWCANHASYCWAAVADKDPLTQQVFNAFWNYMLIGFFPTPAVPGPVIGSSNPGYPTLQTPQYAQALKAYLDAAIRYVASSGLTQADVSNLMTTQPPATYPFDGIDASVAAKRVLALNYLSHAIMCLTRWHKLDAATATQMAATTADLTTGVDLTQAPYSLTPAIPIGTGADMRIHHTDIVNLVRNTRYFYYRYAAQHPYNWAVPRPIEHATMMDYPLLELDLFSEPAAGAIWGAPAGISNPARSGAAALQWKYLSPTRISTVGNSSSNPGFDPLSVGPSMTYPNSPIPRADPSSPSSFFAENGPQPGVVSHLTLLNQFDASERDRELVFWAVDWQSYEDAETAPSAPIDASRYPKAAPGGVVPVNAGADGRGWDNHGRASATFDDLMWGFTDGLSDVTGLEQVGNQNGDWNTVPFHRALVGSYVHAYRNPEKNMLFTATVANLATGSDVSALVAPMHDVDSTIDLTNQAARMRMNSPPDYGPPSAASGGAASPPQIFCGAFGADRNGNGKLDRGAVPKSVRLRAIGVARYNYYDMRVPCQIK